MGNIGTMDDGGRTSSLTIHKPIAAEVRLAWPSEARDFTPWLASNLDVLDVLGIGRLSSIGVEVTLPGTGRSLDLLAEVSDGRRVAIENQFGRADHDHMTRGIAYAVGLGALPEGVAALVVIAEDHASEFVAIADYLNRAAEALGDDGIAVFLVRLGVDRAGDFLIPRFDVLSSPNEWRAQVAEESRLGSVEEFFGRLEPALRSPVEEMVSRWEKRLGGRVGHNAKNAVALYVANPAARAKQTALFVVSGDGNLAINVGYIRESGLLEPGGELEEFEALVERLFPNHATGEKRYYFNARVGPLEPIDELADWVEERGRAWSEGQEADR